MAFIFVVVFEWPATRGSIYTGKFTMKCVASKSDKLVKFKASQGSSLILPKKPRLRHFSLHKKPNMQVIYKMNQGYQNNYNNEDWSDVSVPKWIIDCEECDYKTYDACWPDGSPKMVDLVTNKLITPDKYTEQAKDKYGKDVQTENAALFNSKAEEAAKKLEHEVFMAKLPRFSAAMLKRMEEAKSRTCIAKADDRFYTWKKGVSASKTSHTAWGHRRSGGGKGKKEKISIKDTSEEAKLAKAAAKRIRQTLNKEKGKIEMAKRVEAITRIQKQIAKDAIDVDSEAEELTEEQLMKIEIAKINEENMKKTRKLVVENIDFTREYFVEKTVEPKEHSSWSVVDKKSKKQDSIAKKIEMAFYTDNAREDFVKEVSKKPMSKAVKRTRFCSSVLKGGKCPHGSRCNFAHTMEQLTPKMCAFEKRGSCRCVNKSGSTFLNKGRKVCEYLHEGETKANMCRRLGVKVAEAVCKPVTKCLPVVKATPMGTKVLKPYSKTMAWGPVV